MSLPSAKLGTNKQHVVKGHYKQYGKMTGQGNHKHTRQKYGLGTTHEK